MNSESNVIVGGLVEISSRSSSNSEDIQVLDEDHPYSLIGTSNALLSFAIAITSVAIPLFVVLNERPHFIEESTPVSLEPYGSKYYRPLAISRTSQHSC